MNDVRKITPNPKLADVWTLTWQRLGPRKFAYAAGLILSLSQSLIMMLEPLMVNLVFNALEAREPADVRLIVAAGTALFFFLIGTFLAGEYLKQDALNELNAGLMTQAADEAQRLPLEHAQSAHSSDLVQRAAHDTQRMTGIMNLILDRMTDQIVMFALAAVYLLVLNWRIALLLLAAAPLIVAAGHLIRKRLQQVGREIAEQEAVVRQRLQDALQSMEIVRALGAEDWMLERFTEERRALNRLYVRRTWWQQAVMLTTSALSNLIILVAMLVVGWLAIRGEMALGSLMVYFTLVWRINSPLESIGQLWGQVQENLGASERIFRLLQAAKEPGQGAVEEGGVKETTETAIAETDAAEPDAAETEPDAAEPDAAETELAEAANVTAASDTASAARSGLVMRNVSFRYRTFTAPLLPADDAGGGTDRAIQPFDLTLPPGTFTALVGPSGSGKSTAAKLAAGLLFPQSGHIRVCGRDPLTDADAARALIACAPQTPFLFGGTIRDNIAVGRPDASADEVEAAARAAMADRFIADLPDGWDTMIREHGMTLSGGQKQRIALARVFLSGRPVWILDEATSALDAETERLVVEKLHRFKSEGYAILFIAHRLTAVTDADEIIVMQDGAVMQRGTHGQLLEDRQGLYRRLWANFDPQTA